MQNLSLEIPGGKIMGSMAFWYKKGNPKSAEKIEAVMNFNLWTQCKVESSSFIDIGFLISNISVASKLFFYMPFVDAKINDLSNTIKESKSISAIFNEKYSVVDSSDTNRFWPVLDVNNNAVFVIYSWEKQTDSAVNYRHENNGTIVEIDTEKILRQINDISIQHVSKEKKYYFRFRVQIPEPKQEGTIVRRYSPTNSFLQSTWATTYIVDFRFNDLRSLPEHVSEMTTTQETEFVPITKLHFFLMTKAHVDVETGARDITLRELEENTWDEYIDRKFDTKDIVAYHCSEKQAKDKKKPPINQWEFFAKLRVNNSTWKVLSLYLLVLAGITVFLNCISNVVWLAICNKNGWGITITIVFYIALAIILAAALRRNKTYSKNKKQ